MLAVSEGPLVWGEFHDNSRFIPQTNHTATADYNSLFLNPSLTISRRFDRQAGMVLRPLASISYTVARYGRYSERQAEGFNLDINARSARNLLTRLQLGGSWQSAKTSELGLRLGLEGRFIGGSKFKGSLLNAQRLPVPGASFNNASRTDNSVANIYIGIDGRHRLSNEEVPAFSRFEQVTDYSGGFPEFLHGAEFQVLHVLLEFGERRL